MTNGDQPNHRRGTTPGSRLRAFLFRRTILRDVIQGIIAGGILAFVTAILLLCSVDRHMQMTVNGWSVEKAMKAGAIKEQFFEHP